MDIVQPLKMASRKLMKQQADHEAQTGEGFATLLTFGHNYEDQHRPRERVQRERGTRPLDALGTTHRAPSFPEGHMSSPHHFLGRLDFTKSGPGILHCSLGCACPGPLPGWRPRTHVPSDRSCRGSGRSCAGVRSNLPGAP